jgi:rhodanese-related sulfurtransferase
MNGVEVPEIDVEALDSHRVAGAPVIDVRQPDEYEERHVPGAVLIPLDELPERIDDIPMDQPIYIVCETGARSQRAAGWLLRQGYDATNVAGGTTAWERAGKPTVTGSEAG